MIEASAAKRPARFAISYAFRQGFAVNAVVQALVLKSRYIHHDIAIRAMPCVQAHLLRSVLWRMVYKPLHIIGHDYIDSALVGVSAR